MLLRTSSRFCERDLHAMSIWNNEESFPLLSILFQNMTPAIGNCYAALKLSAESRKAKVVYCLSSATCSVHNTEHNAKRRRVSCATVLIHCLFYGIQLDSTFTTRSGLFGSFVFRWTAKSCGPCMPSCIMNTLDSTVVLSPGLRTIEPMVS